MAWPSASGPSGAGAARAGRLISRALCATARRPSALFRAIQSLA